MEKSKGKSGKTNAQKGMSVELNGKKYSRVKSNGCTVYRLKDAGKYQPVHFFRKLEQTTEA